MPLKAFGFWSGKINYNHTYKEILANREAKFKTSLRVGFFLDFRNFIFASFAAKIKKYLQVINISIESYSFYFGMGKNRNQNCDISVENRQTKFSFLKFCVCVNTHKI